jgi:hypothetical protein
MLVARALAALNRSSPDIALLSKGLSVSSQFVTAILRLPERPGRFDQDAGRA